MSNLDVYMNENEISIQNSLISNQVGGISNEAMDEISFQNGQSDLLETIGDILGQVQTSQLNQFNQTKDLNNLSQTQLSQINKSLQVMGTVNGFDTIKELDFYDLPVALKNIDQAKSNLKPLHPVESILLTKFEDIKSATVTPFHTMKSWAPNVDQKYLDLIIPPKRSNALHRSLKQDKLNQALNQLIDHQKIKNDFMTKRKSKRNQFSNTSLLEDMKPRLPKLSTLTHTANIHLESRKIFSEGEFSNDNKSITQIQSFLEDELKTNHNNIEWEKNVNIVKKELKKLQIYDSEHDDTLNNIGTNERKQAKHSNISNTSNSITLANIRVTNSGMLGLSNRLQRKIHQLKNFPEEMLAFNQRLEQILIERSQLKKKPKANVEILRRNAKNIENQLFDKRLKDHLEKLEKKSKNAQETRIKLEIDTYTKKNQNMESKLMRLEEISKIKTAPERIELFQNMERKRNWLTIIIIGNIFQKFHEAITEDRKTRIHTVTLHSDATESERNTFNILKRRLLMDIRNESKNDITSNPFVASIRFSLHKRQIAAQMIRGYLQEQLKAKVIISTIRQYKFKVVKCQRFVKQFLKCKKSREYLLSIQFKDCEKHRLEQTKKLMLEELSSINIKGVTVPSSFQRHVKKKRIQIINKEEMFATIPKEIRQEFVKKSLRSRRLAFIKQQIEWEKKYKAFQESKFSKDDYIRQPLSLQFSTLLSPLEISELVEQAEIKVTELGRKVQERSSRDLLGISDRKIRF